MVPSVDRREAPLSQVAHYNVRPDLLDLHSPMYGPVRCRARRALRRLHRR